MDLITSTSFGDHNSTVSADNNKIIYYNKPVVNNTMLFFFSLFMFGMGGGVLYKLHKYFVYDV